MPSFDIKALEKCFKQTAIKESFEDLYYSLGFITAVSSSPEAIKPSEWIEQLATTEDKKPKFDDEQQVKVFTHNLIAWWDQCNQVFDLGETIELPEKLSLTAGGKPNKFLVAFSTGYLDGFDWLYDTWLALLPEDNEEAHRTLSVLNFILARFIDEKAMAKSEPQLYKQLPDTKGCLKVLPKLLSGVGMLGQDIAVEPASNSDEIITGKQGQASSTDLAQKLTATPFKNISRSVGRNDSCPCGSGKKFKKCCLH